jgi:hypothetical protein
LLLLLLLLLLLMLAWHRVTSVLTLHAQSARRTSAPSS